MDIIHEKGSPFDYSEGRIMVYFEVADKKNMKALLEGMDFVDGYKEQLHGFILRIAIQQIPEVITNLCRENIALYEVRKLNV